MNAKLEAVALDVSEGVALVSLDRPARLNAMDASMKRNLREIFYSLLPQDPSVRCVVITGRGEKAFSAGADLRERAAEVIAPQPFFERQRETHRLFTAIEEFELPVIAALNGVAAGAGLELALCCDIRIASTHARLGLPEVGLGMVPAAGGTQRLPRLIGASRAKELLFTSELIGAEAALGCGLVSKIVAPAELIGEAMAMASRIARQPPLAVRFAKRAVNAGANGGMESGLEFERYAAAMLIDTNDRKEGMQAFVEKRAPVFRGF